MADRYGDRDFERYDERREGEYDREADYNEDRGGLYGRGTDQGSTWRSPRLARDYDDFDRDAGPRAYGRDYYGARPGAYGGGYAGGGYERAARDEERYERPRVRDYEQTYERGGDDERERADRHGYNTDYGRSTSRFFGRDRGETLPGQVPPDYGRDYEGDRGRGHEGERGRDYERGRERGYGVRHAGGPDYGDYERRGYEAYRPEREQRDRGGRHRREDERGRGGRGWIDRAADEVLSWFGDEDAERRRRTEGERGYRGRGPKNYRRPDERIREDINDRLTEHEYLDASDIEVTVIGGEVILSGEVDNRHAKRLAEDIAESVTGVSNVQNNLRVQRERRTTTPGAEHTGGGTTGHAAGGATGAATYTPGLAGLGSGPGATGLGGTTDLGGSTGLGGSTSLGSTGLGTTGTSAASDAETTSINPDASSRAAGSNS